MRPSLRILPLLLSVLLVAAASAQAQMSPLAKVGGVATPASDTSLLHRSVVPLAAQTRISAVLGREQRTYRATAEERGFRVENSRNRISAEFTSSGVELDDGSGRGAMRLSQYGYGRNLLDAKAARPDANANRVEYRRGTLTEWYLNGPFGLEQGFTLSHAPGKSNGQPLTLTLALSGLAAAVDPGARSVSLRRGQIAAWHYRGLTVTDAKKLELPAWFEVAGDLILLRVDDSRAEYPITIDPVLQAVLTPSDSGSCCDFAYGQPEVAISTDGNTIVVGAPGTSYSDLGPDVGTAYVFVKPSTGWANTSSFAVELVPSIRSKFSGYGNAVGISDDGNTIIVGAEFVNPAFVFVAPATGWGSTCTGPPCVVNENAQLALSSGQAVGVWVAVSGDGNTAAAGDCCQTALFVKPASGWTGALLETNVLVGPLGATMIRLSTDGNTLAIGAPFVALPDSGSETGEVQVYTTTDGWISVTSSQLTASDGATLYNLGYFIAISGDGSTIVAAAPGAAVNGNAQQGAAYVFVRGSAWGSATETVKLVSSDNAQQLGGDGVGITEDGGGIVAKAAGYAYLFVRPSSGWASSSPLTETAKLTGSPFGGLVAISGDSNTIAIGFLRSDTSAAVDIFTGSAVAPTASVSTSTLAFGNQAAGTASAEQSVMLTNTGTEPLHVAAVSATANFTTTQNCFTQSPIAAGGSCSENVAFAPGSVGAFTGSLTFTDDSGGTAGAMQTVNLSGTGVKATTSTTITSASPNPALVGQAVTFSFSVAPPVGDTLTPTGTVTVTASTGENCTGAAPSGSCSITFTSPVTRTVTASYGGDSDFISSTSTNASEQVVDFSLSVSPSSQTMPPGHLASYTLTARSLNGFTGTLTLTCGALPPHSSCAITPASVNLSSSTATATVQIDQENKGTYTLTFTGSYGTVATHTVTASLTVK